MTQQEVEAFLAQHRMELLESPIDWDTEITYRTPCPLDSQTLVFTWSRNGDVKAQCLHDFCEINRHEDDSFAFVKSLVQADVAERDASVPERPKPTRDALVPDARDAPVPEDEHDSASSVPDGQQNDRDSSVSAERDWSVPEEQHGSDWSVPGEDYVSDSPVPAPEMAPRDASVPAKDQVINDLLLHFLTRATEQRKDELLTFLRHGSNSEGIQPFIDDCFVRSFGSRVEEKDVYRQYKAWCIKNGQYLHTKTDLYQFLEHQGYRRKKSNGKKYFAGLQHRDAGVPSVS